jgi:flagellar protein FliS
MNHSEIATLYRETSARGSHPMALIVKLYDAILEDLRRAMNAASAGNAQERTASLNHALLIIAELQSVLDHGDGREVATRLDGFYNVTRGLIIEANIRSNPDQIQKIIDLYLPLRQAWRQVELEISSGNMTFSAPTENSSVPGEFANAPAKDSDPDQERAQWNA